MTTGASILYTGPRSSKVPEHVRAELRAMKVRVDEARRSAQRRAAQNRRRYMRHKARVRKNKRYLPKGEFL